MRFATVCLVCSSDSRAAIGSSQLFLLSSPLHEKYSLCDVAVEFAGVGAGASGRRRKRVPDIDRRRALGAGRPGEYRRVEGGRAIRMDPDATAWAGIFE